MARTLHNGDRRRKGLEELDDPFASHLALGVFFNIGGHLLLCVAQVAAPFDEVVAHTDGHAGHIVVAQLPIGHGVDGFEKLFDQPAVVEVVNFVARITEFLDGLSIFLAAHLYGIVYI